MAEGFAAFEALLQHHPSTGEFCDGVAPGIADCCLIPQVYNARRFGVDLTPYPTIVAIEKACLALPAFDAARRSGSRTRPHNHSEKEGMSRRIAVEVFEAIPARRERPSSAGGGGWVGESPPPRCFRSSRDRKSTRMNSSH